MLERGYYENGMRVERGYDSSSLFVLLVGSK